MGKINEGGQRYTQEVQQMYDDHMIIARPHKRRLSRLPNRNLRLKEHNGKKKEFTWQIMNICENHIDDVD